MAAGDAGLRGGNRGKLRRTRGYFLIVGLIGLIAGLSVVTDVGAALNGVVPAISRTLLGVVGLAAVGFMWWRPPLGRRLGMMWALVQIPFFGTNLGGSFTAQSVSFPLVMASPSTADGQGTVSFIGINLVGVVFAVWLSFLEDTFRYPDDIA